MQLARVIDVDIISSEIICEVHHAYLTRNHKFISNLYFCKHQNPRCGRLSNVNVCIHDFDDVKEESNKAASNDKHLLQE